jgi:multidrug efflux pump subunit AcrA (membrane-fusion protein)
MYRFGVLLCLAIFLSSCAVSASAPPAPTPTPRPVQAALEKPTYPVQRGEVVDELKLSGHVAAIKQQDLSFTQDGYLKTLYIDRSSVITQGMLLAELDLGELPNQLRQAQVALEQAQLERDRDKDKRKIEQARAQLDLEDARAKLADLQAPAKAEDLARAKAALDQAQAGLDSTRSSASATKTNAELNLQQSTGALTQAQSAFSIAQQNWQHVQDTGTDPIQPSKTENGKSKPNVLNDAQRQQYYDAFVQAQAALHNAEVAVAKAQVDYDAARQAEGPAIRQAEAALALAQANLNALTSGPRSADIAAARRQIERATLAIQEAQQGGDSELDNKVASAQLDVERIQAKIDAGRIYAPFSGTVSAIGSRPGQNVSAYKAVVSVMDAAALELLIENITSLDATKIGVGQPVQLSFSRYRGKTFDGQIVRLPTTQVSGSSTVNEDTAYHISFDQAGQPFEVGDIAEVRITLAKKDNALWLPPQAVRAFEGRRFVVIKEGDRQRRADVKVGIVSTDRIEILEGVKEGDVVVGQ